MDRRIRSVWPSVALLLAACASGGQTPQGDVGIGAAVVLVEVENNLARRQSVTVRIESQSGGVTTLGTVGPGRTATLRFEEDFFESFYMLSARLDDGSTVDSREFSLSPGALVRWRLSNNTISVGTR